MATAEISFPCVFCGQARDEDDPVTVKAHWQEDGQERWQAWGAHRACMIDAMDALMRDQFGAPFTDAE
jgi:hypothetical protein